MKYYTKTNKYMVGRIDDTDDYSQKRLHQHIKYIDLTSKEFKELSTDSLSFGIISYEVDEGVKRNKGRIGASLAPKIIKEYLASKPCCFEESVIIYDFGSIKPLDDDLNLIQLELSKCIKMILDKNIFPIVIGGGHDVAYASINAHQNMNNNFGVINFDAHFDNRPFKGEASSGTPFSQYYKDTIDNNINYNYIALGINETSNTSSLFNQANKNGIKYITDDDFNFNDIKESVKKIDKYIDDSNIDNIHITICTDVFSSSIAPGVSAPASVGINIEKFMFTLKHLMNKSKVKSFDIAEVNPKFDIDNRTSRLAAHIIISLINYRCKQGGL